jgi:hypothetical protein
MQRFWRKNLTWRDWVLNNLLQMYKILHRASTIRPILRSTPSHNKPVKLTFNYATEFTHEKFPDKLKKFALAPKQWLHFTEIDNIFKVRVQVLVGTEHAFESNDTLTKAFVFGLMFS